MHLIIQRAEINTDTSFYSFAGVGSVEGRRLLLDRLGRNHSAEPALRKRTCAPLLIKGRHGCVDLPHEPGGYFVYFPDWIANGTTQPTTATIVSVARAPLASVLEDAFGERPHAARFEKYYEGAWGPAWDWKVSVRSGSEFAWPCGFGRTWPLSPTARWIVT